MKVVEIKKDNMVNMSKILKGLDSKTLSIACENNKDIFDYVNRFNGLTDLEMVIGDSVIVGLNLDLINILDYLKRHHINCKNIYIHTKDKKDKIIIKVLITNILDKIKNDKDLQEIIELNKGV